jgi:hypothetical protein
MVLPPSSRRGEEMSDVRRVNRTMFVAGLLQIASIYSPAARVKIYGLVPFLRVPHGGVALLTLGVLTLVVALRPIGWWRWIPSGFTAGVLAFIYWRVTRNPSRTFVDPLLRHLMHPSWGFVPMGIAVAIGLVGAAMVRVSGRAEPQRALDAALGASPSTTQESVT